MDLYLVRHTTLDIARNICYGQSDIDVGPSFDAELGLLRQKLPPQPDVIYSSPSQRCLKLARAVAGEQPVRQEARLMELHFGEWELKCWDDIPRGAVDVWAEDHVLQAPPQGESFHALHARAADFLREASNAGDANIFAFTHAGVIRALLAEALQLPLVQAFRLQIDYASVSQIVIDGLIWRVVGVNR